MSAALKQVEEFDSSKYFLGSLCKRGHDWNGTGQTLKYKANSKCKICNTLVHRDYIHKRNALSATPDRLQCPLPSCDDGKVYKSLFGHFQFWHGLATKQDVIDAGIEWRPEFFSTKHKEAVTQRNKQSGRENIDEVVAITHCGDGYIVVPQKLWNTGCKFARIAIDKRRGTLEFRPTLIKLQNYRSVSQRSEQFYISISPELVNTLHAGDAILYSENGVVGIQFRNLTMLRLFESWARTRKGNGINSPFDLRIIGKTQFSINSNIWPVRGQYVYVSWSGKSLFLKPLIQKEPGSFKLRVCKQRFHTNAVNFFKSLSAPLPAQEWRLRETLPDGTLRFSPWGKGRKHAPMAINPVIDHLPELETVKPAQQQVSDFEDWLNEVEE
jgi:hypothetical protein